MSPSPTQFQTWRGYRYAYDVWNRTPQERPAPAEAAVSNRSNTAASSTAASSPPDLALLLIHPIGVGLSRQFWQRFNQAWVQTSDLSVYNPDLLGCGDSDLPKLPYRPLDWAGQLQHFLETVVQQPTLVVAQGALAPAAIELCRLEREKLDVGTSHLRGLVLSGPPAWRLMTTSPPPWQKRLAWGLFSSPLGAAFYRYARRPQFLESFSRKQLFASDATIDSDWIEPLRAGAADPATRHAVFAFLSRFWQQDYGDTVANIALPTLILFGEEASSISRNGKGESLQERLRAYEQAFPQGKGQVIPGRNVLPYESTTEFVAALQAFIHPGIHGEGLHIDPRA